MKCREVTAKKKRVETFRNIRYPVGRVYIYYYYYTDSAAAVRLSVGLTQARPNYVTDSAAAVGPPVGLAQARPNNNIICTYMYHRLQLSRNLRDSPGFVEFVPDNLLFVPEVVQHLSL